MLIKAKLFYFLHKHLFPVLAFAFLALLLSPIICSGLYSDDLMNYQLLKSIPDFTFSKMIGYSNGEITKWLKIGRFTPLSFYLFVGIYWLSHSILQYKLLVYTANVFAVLSFVYFLQKSKMGNLTGLSLMLLGMLFQFQISHHDPFTSLNAMYPIATAFSLLAVGLFLYYIDSKSIFKLAGAFVFATMALLITEIGIVPFLVFYGLIVFHFKKLRQRMFQLAPLLLLPILYFVTLKIIRENSTLSYIGTEMSFNAEGMRNVFICQMFSTLPLSNFYKVYAIPEVLFLQLSNPLVLFIALVMLCLGGLLLFNTQNQKWGSGSFQLDNFFIGLVFLFVPAMILMVSVKYQSELRLGIAYLPVYFQIFGLTIVLTEILNAFPIAKILHYNAAKVSIISICIIIGISTFLLNCCMIKAKNTEQSIPAQNFYSAIKHGLLNPVENNSVMVLGIDFIFKQPVSDSKMIFNYYGKTLDIIKQEDFNIATMDTNRQTYMCDYDRTSGKARLFKMDKTSGTFIKINEMNYQPLKPLQDIEMQTVRKLFI